MGTIEQNDGGGIGAAISTVILSALQHEVMLRCFRIHYALCSRCVREHPSRLAAKAARTSG